MSNEMRRLIDLMENSSPSKRIINLRNYTGTDLSKNDALTGALTNMTHRGHIEWELSIDGDKIRLTHLDPDIVDNPAFTGDPIYIGRVLRKKDEPIAIILPSDNEFASWEQSGWGDPDIGVSFKGQLLGSMVHNLKASGFDITMEDSLRDLHRSWGWEGA